MIDSILKMDVIKAIPLQSELFKDMDPSVAAACDLLF